MKRFKKSIVLLTILSAASLNLTCFDMYNDIWDGAEMRVTAVISTTTGLQLHTIAGPEYIRNDSALLPALSGYYVKTVVSDFNNDGKADIIALNTNSSTTIEVLTRNDKFFVIDPYYTKQYAMSTPSDMVLSDFNNDNLKRELFISEFNGSPNFATELINSSWDDLEFTRNNKSISAGDLDNDGDIDVYIGRQNPHAGKVLLNDYNDLSGLLNFISGWINPNSTLDTLDTSIIDVDNDKDLDIIEANNAGGVYVYYNDGTAGFSAPVIYPNSTCEKICTGDFNNDGFLDIFIARNVNGCSSMLNNGNGTFTVKNFSIYNLIDCSKCDINFDGFLDIIAVSTSSIVILTNDKNGNFSQSYASFIPAAITGISLISL
jgi:hypothetical protein